MAVMASSTSALRVPVELLIQHSEPVFESWPAMGRIKGIVRGLQKIRNITIIILRSIYLYSSQREESSHSPAGCTNIFRF